MATIAAGFSPDFVWLAAFRFIAGVGLGAGQPLYFSYTAEYAPKNIRGRILALMQLIGGAFVAGRPSYSRPPRITEQAFKKRS